MSSQRNYRSVVWECTYVVVIHGMLEYIKYFSSTAVDCGALTNPANDRVSHTGGVTFRQTATYRCNTGYILVGSSILTLV